MKVLKLVDPFRKSERGAELAEFGLIAFVCVVAVGQLVMAGLQVSWEKLALLIGGSRRGLRQ